MAAQRLTVAETGGRQRAYSYLLREEQKLTPGEFSSADLPDELLGELEDLGQGNSAPGFLWEPVGPLRYSITEA